VTDLTKYGFENVAEYDLIIRRVVVEAGSKPEAVQAVLLLATMEQPIMKIPADWWQAFKQRWFPEWLKARFPVEWAEIEAIHKFPEVDVPWGLGKEHVHLSLVRMKE
jgi:hypothetical protein